MDDVRPLRGADPVNGELEVGFDQAFERRWLFAERLGRIIMLLIVGVAIAGLLGRGPYSHESEKNSDGSLTVDFEPVARSQTGTQVSFHIDNPTASPTLDLFIGSTAVEPMGLQRILPQPLNTQAVEGGLKLTIAIPPGAHDAVVRLMLAPLGMGPNELRARLEGHPLLRWTQFVVP